VSRPARDFATARRIEATKPPQRRVCNMEGLPSRTVRVDRMLARRVDTRGSGTLLGSAPLDARMTHG